MNTIISNIINKEFIFGIQDCFNIWKSINAIHQISRLKKKTGYDHLKKMQKKCLQKSS